MPTFSDQTLTTNIIHPDCEAGYWCLSGSTTKAPMVGSTLYDVCTEDPDIGEMKAGICPVGV